MPIYEYQCGECGHVFDALQKMSDEPLTDCPDCGQPELRKLMSAPNFRLKGAGWYETDFKDKNQRNLVDGSDGKSADKNSGINLDKSAEKNSGKSSGKGTDKPGLKSADKSSASTKPAGGSSGSSD
jgi:putative FmdB family regulatory protein